jgi:hypothetical protein
VWSDVFLFATAQPQATSSRMTFLPLAAVAHKRQRLFGFGCFAQLMKKDNPKSRKKHSFALFLFLKPMHY